MYTLFFSIFGLIPLDKLRINRSRENNGLRLSVSPVGGASLAVCRMTSHYAPTHRARQLGLVTALSMNAYTPYELGEQHA